MKTNKILTGGIAGGISFFLLGWVIYGILLKDFMATNYNQCAMRPMEEMIMWAMIVSNLAYGFMLSFVLTWSNTTSVIAGAKISGIVGFLLAVAIDMSFYAMTTMFSNFTLILVDVIVYIVMGAISGAIVAWVMGMIKK